MLCFFFKKNVGVIHAKRNAWGYFSGAETNLIWQREGKELGVGGRKKVRKDRDFA